MILRRTRHETRYDSPSPTTEILLSLLRVTVSTRSCKYLSVKPTISPREDGSVDGSSDSRGCRLRRALCRTDDDGRIGKPRLAARSLLNNEHFFLLQVLHAMHLVGRSVGTRLAAMEEIAGRQLLAGMRLIVDFCQWRLGDGFCLQGLPLRVKKK